MEMKVVSKSKELGRKKREKVAMTVLIGALITVIIAIIKF